MISLPQTYMVPYDYVFDFANFPLAVKPLFDRPSPGLHDHERFWEIVLAVSGEALYCCNGKKYTVRSHEILVTLPGMTHNYEQMHLDYYNILVDFATLKLPLFDLSVTRGYQKIFVLGPHSHLEPGMKLVRNFLDDEQFNEAVRLLKRMYDLQCHRATGFQLAMIASFTDFLRVICRAGEPEKRESTNVLRPQTIAELAIEMTRRCQENWTIERLCHVCHLSRSVLFREFRKYYRISPKQFLTRQRLQKVCSLLQSSELPIETIASRCGFANGSYLSTAFSQYFGMSPLQYRQSSAPIGLLPGRRTGKQTAEDSEVFRKSDLCF